MDGNKTYAVAIGFVLTAAGAYLMDHATWQADLAMVLSGAGLAAIRSAIAKMLDHHKRAADAAERMLDAVAKLAK